MSLPRNLSILAENANSTGILQPAGGGTGTAGTSVILNNATLGAGNATGFKNRIINGGMQIDQRNAGAAVIPTVNGTYLVDRWLGYITQPSKLSFQQLTNSTPVNGFSNYLNIASLSAYSVLSTDGFALQQRIEGFNVADLGWGTASAKTVTLSFNVNCSLTGTFGGAVYNAASNRFYPFSYSIPVANTLTAISVTIPGDTSGTWVYNNGVGMVVSFGLGAGSTLSQSAGSWTVSAAITCTGAVSLVGTSGATFAITGVQLEIGSTATSFDVRDYGRELIMCQRYYEKVQQVMYGGYFNLANYAGVIWTYKSSKRSAPTIVLASGSSGGAVFSSGTDFVGVLNDINATATIQAGSTASAEL